MSRQARIGHGQSWLDGNFETRALDPLHAERKDRQLRPQRKRRGNWRSAGRHSQELDQRPFRKFLIVDDADRPALPHRIKQRTPGPQLLDKLRTSRPERLDPLVHPGVVGLPIDVGHGQSGTRQDHGPDFPVREVSTGKHRVLSPGTQHLEGIQSLDLESPRPVR